MLAIFLIKARYYAANSPQILDIDIGIGKFIISSVDTIFVNNNFQEFNAWPHKFTFMQVLLKKTFIKLQ